MNTFYLKHMALKGLTTDYINQENGIFRKRISYRKPKAGSTEQGTMNKHKKITYFFFQIICCPLLIYV